MWHVSIFLALVIIVTRPPCSLLASGSDDLDVILWDPLAKKCVARIQTGHSGNIFSVKVKRKKQLHFLQAFLLIVFASLW